MYTKNILDKIVESSNSQEKLNVLLNIKERIEKGEKVYKVEVNYFCNYMQFSMPPSICNETYFKRLFLIYFDFPENGLNLIEPEMRPTPEQVNLDIETLIKHGTRWYKIVKTENHSKRLKKIVSVETRKILKELKKSLPSHFNNKQSNEYLYARMRIILLSKYFYIMLSESIEEFNAEKIKITHLKGYEFFITIDSITHISFQHFGKIALGFTRNIKTYFAKDFHARYLITQVKDLLANLSSIDFSFLSKSKTSKLYVEFNRQLYVFYFKENLEDINNKFNELKTFYPVNLAYENMVLSDFNLSKINDATVLYLPK